MWNASYASPQRSPGVAIGTLSLFFFLLRQPLSDVWWLPTNRHRLHTNRHRLHTNRHRLHTNRHRLPTNRHRLPTGRHHRAYWTLRVFFFLLLWQPLTQPLVGWIVGRRTLEASSIDVSFAPPLIVAHGYNLGNFHWVLHLLIAPTREYLCLKFDPLFDRPQIVGANHEELAVVDLFAEREGIQPQQRKKWAKILHTSVPLHMQLHPCIPPSSGRLMVSVAIRHVS